MSLETNQVQIAHHVEHQCHLCNHEIHRHVTYLLLGLGQRSLNIQLTFQGHQELSIFTLCSSRGRHPRGCPDDRLPQIVESHGGLIRSCTSGWSRTLLFGSRQGIYGLVSLRTACRDAFDLAR